MATGTRGKKHDAPLTYGQAMARLDEIVERIGEGEVDVDDLAESVREAAVLVRTCREKLRSTQDEVTRALADLEASAGPTPAAQAAVEFQQPRLVTTDDTAEYDPFAEI